MSSEDETNDSPRVFHGVDFSGSKRAAKKIWVATCDGTGAAETKSGYSHQALVEAISSSQDDGRRHYWLVDAPVGLPVDQLRALDVAETWDAARAWLGSFESPRDWRRACRAVSRKEPRRETDRLAKTPMAPSNLRVFKQTWHLIAKVLTPLASDAGVAIVPMGIPEGDSAGEYLKRPVWVGEGCPSSTLRDRGWPDRGYKGRGDGPRAKREEIVHSLTETTGLEIEAKSRRAAIEDDEGDALDSLLLIDAAQRFAHRDLGAVLEEQPVSRTEGFVFV